VRRLEEAMSEPHVHRNRPRGLVRVLGAGVAVALALSGCGGSSSSGASSEPSVSIPSSPVSALPISSGSGGSTSQQPSGLSGTWTGKYGGTFSGTFTLNWVQTGSKLHGKITLSTSGTVPVNGTVDGDAIKFGTVGSTAVTYTGTSSGTSMSGSYDTASGGGTWSAQKAS
jgi:hypothetical protein